MSFGKYLLGGVCAVGAVIAAPIVVPAAGLALAGSAATGMAGLTIGLGMAAAPTTTVATVAGVVAGAAGLTAGALQEKQVDDARYEGQKSGYNFASREYENKFQKQVEAFISTEKSFTKDKQEYELLINDLENYIYELEQDLKNRSGHDEVTMDLIKLAKNNVCNLKTAASGESATYES